MTSTQLHVSSKRLGDGTSANVHEGVLNGVRVAVKVSGVREDAKRQVRREARRYERLRHPNVLRCFGVAETSNSVVLVAELMAGGSLFSALVARQGKLLPRPSVMGIALQVARALEYLHASGYSLGDMKSLNVLLSEPLDNGRLPRGANVKLCDFGLSRRLRGGGASSNETNDAAAFLLGSTVDPDPNAVAGTFAYLAPECFEGPPSDALGMVAADVYALGVVMWELATVQIPWAGHSIGALMRVVREKRQLPFSPRVRSHAGSRFVRLCQRCWASEADQRPTANEIVVELSQMYDGAEWTQFNSPTAVLYSQVLRDFEPAANTATAHDYTQSTTSSHDSAAVASITSVDDDLDIDEGGSFDMPISVLPSFAREMERRKQHEAPPESDGATDSDSDSSSCVDVDVASDEEDDEDMVVFSRLDDVTIPKARHQAQDKDVSERVEYGEVVLLDDGANSTVSTNKRVRFDAHASYSTTQSQTSTSSRVDTAPSNGSEQPAAAANMQDDYEEQGVYMPDEFIGAGPGLLEATNELSEYSLTFQDASISSQPAPEREDPMPAARYEQAPKLRAVASAPVLPAASPSPGPRFVVRASTGLRKASEATSSAPLARAATLNEMKLPTMRVRASSRAPPRRDYASPPMPPALVARELQSFENEDANADVLSSVMRFSRFVARRP